MRCLKRSRNPFHCRTPGSPDSNEYVFIYDISKQVPSYTPQVLQIPNSYHGIVFDPSGRHFYVAEGPSDMVHTMTLGATGWAEDTPPALTMKHGTGIGLNIKPNGALQFNSAVGVLPCAAGVAISNDGRTLVVANYYNDSLSIFTGGYGNWVAQPDLDLRPGKSATNPQTGVPDSEYPFWVVIKGAGPGATAYVSSIRDREIDVVSLGATPAVTARIHVKGQPNKMTLNANEPFFAASESVYDKVKDGYDSEATAPLVRERSLEPHWEQASAVRGFTCRRGRPYLQRRKMGSLLDLLVTLDRIVCQLGWRVQTPTRKVATWILGISGGSKFSWPCPRWSFFFIRLNDTGDRR